MLVSVEQMTKMYNARTVLSDINLKIEDHDRIGLIGVNGCGKSTLLRLILGIEQPDEGIVSMRNDLTVGYLAQNSGLDRDRTIWEEMKSVFSDLLETEQQLREIERQMAQSPELHEKLSEEYSRKISFFESRDGYLIDVKIRTVLGGMGFADKPEDTVINTLSGGEKTRLAMAKLLLEEPQLLILDEPTNHLDFRTLAWLEEYLSQYKYAILVVSHDRYFLNRLVNSVCEIERTKLTRYKGNYDKYLILKEEQRQRQQKEYEMQQKKIAELEDYVSRNLVRDSTTKQAQSRRRILENMERVERPFGPLASAHFHFTYDRDPHKDLLITEHLTLAVGEPKKILCRDLNLTIRRGDKIAFIGANGVGKTTLLKTIQGMIPPHSGHYTWSPNVKIGYYDQEGGQLHIEKMVIDELWDRFPYMKEQEVRSVLGSVLLTGENVFKQVKVISGGERAKLVFAILSLERGNVLILDEPTNHLDMVTREVLEKALIEFEGSIIMVSHDRYFLNRVSNRIVEMFPDHVDLYEGNYDAYEQRRQFLQARAAEKAAKEAKEQELCQKNEKASGYRSKAQKTEELHRRQQIKGLENQIMTLEEEIQQLEAGLNDPELYQDYQKAREQMEKLERVKARHDHLYHEWESLSE